MSEVQIEDVRGRDDPELDQELLGFWAAQAGLTGPAAHARLSEVVCIARHDGRLAGVCSAFSGRLGPLGDRPFWIYRSFLLPSVAAHQAEMIARAYAVLDRGHQRGDGSPIGLCVLADAALHRARPEAVWTGPTFVYGGDSNDGRQRRIAYFSAEADHSTKPDYVDGQWLPGDDTRILFYSDQDEVTDEDLVAVWTTEGGLPQEEAVRRCREALLVGVSPAGSVVGIATVYLTRDAILGVDVWFFRTLVTAAARKSNLATAFVLTTRDHLAGRFAAGIDTRGRAMVMEIENAGLKAAFPQGYWATTNFHLIGESPNGAHVRVQYFPGALAPPPRPPAV